MLLPLLSACRRLDEQVGIRVHTGHPSSVLQQFFLFIYFYRCIIHYLLIRSRLHTQPFCSSEINSNRIIFSWDYWLSWALLRNLKHAQPQDEPCINEIKGKEKLAKCCNYPTAERSDACTHTHGHTDTYINMLSVQKPHLSFFFSSYQGQQPSQMISFSAEPSSKWFNQTSACNRASHASSGSKYGAL